MHPIPDHQAAHEYIIHNHPLILPTHSDHDFSSISHHHYACFFSFSLSVIITPGFSPLGLCIHASQEVALLMNVFYHASRPFLGNNVMYTHIYICVERKSASPPHFPLSSIPNPPFFFFHFGTYSSLIKKKLSNSINQLVLF